MTLHRVPLAADDHGHVEDLPVTTPRRTLIDLMRSERRGVAQTLFDRALQQGWLSADDVLASVRAGKGRTGNRQLRDLVSAVEPGAEAESERLLHQLLRRASLSGWVPQYVIGLPGREVRVDVAFPDLMLAIEVDGKLYHDESSDRFEDDRARQNELINAGWRVLRFTRRQLNDQPYLVVDTIKRSLAA
ncbi:endonuclease domain-containing protein [Jatrophihabitans sp. DSM 45814]